MLAIITNTFREAIAKKIFIGYYIFYAIVVVAMYFLSNLDAVEGILTLTDVKYAVLTIEAGFVKLSYPLILIFSLITASSFIPSMLEKGTIDLMLSKPLSRFNILFSKFLGATVFVFISMVFLFGSIWLIISARSGYWDPGFLITIFSLTITFGILYSIVVFIGLTTQSSIISILINLFLIFVMCPILSAREAIIFTFVQNSTAQFIINFFYYLLPKPGEIKDLTVSLFTGTEIPFWKTELIPETLGDYTGSWMSLITSLLFCLILMSYSMYYFSKKDY